MALKVGVRVQWRWISACVCLGLMSGCSVHQSVRPTLEATGGNRATTHSEALIEAQPAWFGCRTDNDCQVERGVCNEVQGVNKAFLEPFRQYRDKMSQSVECVNAPLQVAVGPSKCVVHRCTVNVPKSKQTR